MRKTDGFFSIRNDDEEGEKAKETENWEVLAKEEWSLNKIIKDLRGGIDEIPGERL